MVELATGSATAENTSAARHGRLVWALAGRGVGRGGGKGEFAKSIEKAADRSVAVGFFLDDAGAKRRSLLFFFVFWRDMDRRKRFIKTARQVILSKLSGQ